MSHSLKIAVDGAVCLRILRRDAHLDGARICHDGAVPSALVVCVLPDGNHDAGNLQTQKRKEGEKLWKSRRNELRSFSDFSPMNTGS